MCDDGRKFTGIFTKKSANVLSHDLKLLLAAFFSLLLPLSIIPTRAQNKPVEKNQSAGSSTSAAELAQVRRAIDEGNAKWIEAWAKSDADMIVNTFAEDAIELRPDGTVVKSHQQILEHVRESMQRLGPGVQLTVTTTTVWLDGDTAYETGKSLYKYTQKGAPKSFQARYVSIWKRQHDGTWKLFVDMGVPQD